MKLPKALLMLVAAIAIACTNPAWAQNGGGDNPNDCDWEAVTLSAIPSIFEDQADRAAATIIWDQVTTDPVNFVLGDTVTFTGPGNGEGSDNSNWIVGLDCQPSSGPAGRNYNGPTGEVVVLPTDADMELGVWIFINDSTDPKEMYPFLVLENNTGGGGEGEGEGEGEWAASIQLVPSSTFAVEGAPWGLQVSKDFFDGDEGDDYAQHQWSKDGVSMSVELAGASVTVSTDGDAASPVAGDTITLVASAENPDTHAIENVEILHVNSNSGGSSPGDFGFGKGVSGLEWTVTANDLAADGIHIEYAPNYDYLQIVGGDTGIATLSDLITAGCVGNCGDPAKSHGVNDVDSFTIDELALSDAGEYCVEVYTDVQDGDVQDFTACYNLSEDDIAPSGSSVPVGGVLGLSVLSILMALAGMQMLRRRQLS
jgi:hypothetical protein